MDPLPDPPRVTIRDLAKQLGLSHAAVSMALRDHPNMAAETKRRVKEAAKRCGYRPEPMLSALASYRQMKRPSSYHGTLAWLLNYVTAKELFATPLFRQYYEGARKRANMLGFQLEEYRIEPGMTADRMADILRARGVQGILVTPQAPLRATLNLRWEWFSAVAFGFSLKHPQLHLVSSTQYRNGRALTFKMQELGYRRIGFFGSEVFDERTDRNFTAGFHIASQEVPRAQRVPPLLLKEGNSEGKNRELIRQWVTRWKIDAIVCVGGMQGLFLEAGYKIPDDFAVALVSFQAEYPGFAGMDEQGLAVGAAAVDSIVGMIHRGERGIPEAPYRVLIEGKWVDGPSAPPAASHSKAAASRKQARVPKG